MLLQLLMINVSNPMSTSWCHILSCKVSVTIYFTVEVRTSCTCQSDKPFKPKDWCILPIFVLAWRRPWSQIMCITTVNQGSGSKSSNKTIPIPSPTSRIRSSCTPTSTRAATIARNLLKLKDTWCPAIYGEKKTECFVWLHTECLISQIGFELANKKWYLRIRNW